MGLSKLSPRDAGVISKINDPESTTSPILIDPSLPKDPHILDQEVYAAIIKEESAIISLMINLDHSKEQEKRAPKVQHSSEKQDEELGKPNSAFRTKQKADWQACLEKYGALVNEHENYAAARNNRVQALRAVYGDGMLVKLTIHHAGKSSIYLDDMPSVIEDPANISTISETALRDLDHGIRLLTPKVFGAVSPAQAKTLANLYMQRGALYNAASKKLARNGETLSEGTIRVEVRCGGRGEGRWSQTDFQRYASMDFMMAGRYGNEIGKALAVAMNPDAKLCGQIVESAMRQEFGS